MKYTGPVIVVLSLLLLSLLISGTLASNQNPPNTLTVQFFTHGEGKAYFISNSTHGSSYAAELIVPLNASQGSCSMALYPVNQPLSSLQSFQVYTSYTDALPRFVILLDSNSDSQTEVTLMSDYLTRSNSSWQLSQGGQRWGWTNTSNTLEAYSNPWENLGYWQGIYGNATIRFVGVALEYWAVKDAGGLNQPLFADQLVLNGVTYSIANSNSFSTDDWSMYRYDPQNTGTSTSNAPNASPLWQFSTGDKIRSSPAVANGVVYEGSNNGYLYALNATSGQLIWQYNSGSQIESSAAITNGIVYVGILWDGHNGYVDALNATTGSLIWRFATNSGIESSPTVVDGVVYVGSYSGYVYALNADSGSLVWSKLIGGSVFSSPAVVEGVVYVGSCSGYVYALNAANGAIIWGFCVGSDVYASPAVVNNVVYVNSDNGTLYALKAIDGSQIWQAVFGKTDHADDSPAVANGAVYVGSRNGYYAFNASDGLQIWWFTSPYSQRQLTGYVYSSPAVAGNTVYFGSSDSYLFALDATCGSAIWAYRTGGFLFSSPAIANGVVYIGSYDGKIYALGNPNVAAAPVPTQTPQPTATATPMPTANPTAEPPVTTTPAPTAKPTTPPNTPANQNQAINQNAQTQTSTPEPAAVDQDLSINWLILAGIIAVAATALVSLLVAYKKGNISQI